MTKQEALAAIAANVKLVEKILAETTVIAENNEVPFYFYKAIDEEPWVASSDNWNSSSYSC